MYFATTKYGRQKKTAPLQKNDAACFFRLEFGSARPLVFYIVSDESL